MAEVEQQQAEAFDNNQAQDLGAEEVEDDIPEVEMKEVLIFNKWSVSDVRCEDLSLKDYINVSKPVGHQSTNWIVLLVLMLATAALTSLGTTSPRYIKQQAIYLPCLGSHFAIILAGSKHAVVNSPTLSFSWNAFSAEITGAYDESIK